VLVCSLTTMIGYASLLASTNLAIRGFGLASLIGEVTCVAAALGLVPAIVAAGRDAADRGIQAHGVRRTARSMEVGAARADRGRRPDLARRRRGR
jgi:predicted RND superfamily exporter protein